MKRLQSIRSGWCACAGGVLAVALAAICAPSYAQKPPGFPDRPVRLLVSFPPGGAADLTARSLAKGLSELWTQPVVVDNKPGASGLIAGETLAKAPGDGYTLLVADDGMLTLLPFFQGKMPYDTLSDLVPVGMIASAPVMLVANPALKVKTLAELVAAARARPGGIDYASAGVGGGHHMAMERFQRAAGITLNHVPYKGGAPALLDVVAGRIPMMFAGVAAFPFIKDGRLVPLAMGTLERSPLMPEVPTVAESGYPGFEANLWMGVVAPKGTPPALLDKISSDIEKITRTPAYHDSLVSRGNEVRSSTARAFSERIRNEYESNRALIRNAGIKGE